LGDFQGWTEAALSFRDPTSIKPHDHTILGAKAMFRQANGSIGAEPHVTAEQDE
jgi:hypothetical protein